MAINFPTSLDTLTNPTATDSMAVVSHSSQHANINDAVEALEAKVGINSSAVTTSHDYKLSEVTSTDKAVGKTATQTLTNKTLTSPVINVGSDASGDMYYRNGSGVLTRIAAGTTGQFLKQGGSSIPAFADLTNASTTAAGMVEEATLAETLARTATGGTGARTFVSPANVISNQQYDYAADAGSTDTYAITVAPAPTAYVVGQAFTFKANTDNNGTATLNVNSLGATTIVRNDGATLQTGDILANGIYTVIYNGTNMLLQNQSNGSPYSISTDLQDKWFTTHLPVVSSSTTAMAGWTFSSATVNTDNYSGYVLVTGSGGNGQISTPLLGVGTSDVFTYDSAKSIRVKLRARFMGTGNRKGFGLATTVANVYAVQTDTTNGQIKFHLNGSTLYAANANGTTATSTDITSGVSINNWNTYEIVYTPSTSAKFYVNGALVATHTTNLPTTGNPLFAVGVSANTEAVKIASPIISYES